MMGPILKKEMPYAQVVSEEHIDQICSHCMNFFENGLKRCPGCKFVHYCSSRCQRLDWQDHKSECELISSSRPLIPTYAVRLLARIILKQKRIPPAAFNGRKLDDLKAYTREILSNPLRNAEYQIVAASLYCYMGKQLFPSTAELLDLYGKVMSGSVMITNPLHGIIGSGLYVGFSELKHSCNPNASFAFEGNAMVLSALKDDILSYSSKLRIPCSTLLDLDPKRQGILKERWIIERQCSLCQVSEKSATRLSIESGYSSEDCSPLDMDDFESAKSQLRCIACNLSA